MTVGATLDLHRRIRTGPNAGRTWGERFSDLVASPDPSGCSLWLGGRYRNGYGRFSVGSKYELAHRVSAILAGMPLRAEDTICHVCDNRLCVSPNHLAIGNAAINSRDASWTGRAFIPWGERSGRAKLTEADVLLMRGLRKQGWLQKELAERFGVSRKQVSVVTRGIQWGRLSDGFSTERSMNRESGT